MLSGRPIGWKLTAAFLLVTIVSVGASGAVFFGMTRNELLSERRIALLTQANMASVSVARGAPLNAPGDPPFSLVHQLSLQIGARLLVLDPGGRVRADSAAGPGTPGTGGPGGPETGGLTGRRITHQLVGRAAEGGQNTALQRLDGGGWAMYAAVPIVQNQTITGILFVSRSADDIAETLRSLAHRLGAAMGGSILIVIGAGILVGRRITAPLGEMTRAAEAMARGDLSRRVKVRGHDELAALGRAFNHMAGRLAGAEEARRRFIGDASHEMRTPLATIKLTAENLAAETDDQKIIPSLQAIDRQVDRLTGMVESLLVLTRLDQLTAAEGAIPKETIDLRRLLEKVLTDMEPAAAERGVTLSLSLDGSPGRQTRLRGAARERSPEPLPDAADGAGSRPLWLEADEDGLYRVFRNLLENGIRYTPTGGRVAVTCRWVGGTPLGSSALRGSGTRGPRHSGAAYIVEVADDGPGIAPEHVARIFERFYRADAARSRDEGGFGLGLAIADEIVSLHGGTIEVSDRPGAGTVFTVRLPISNL